MQRFAPQQGAAAEQTLERLREHLAARDYAAVIGALPGAMTELESIKANGAAALVAFAKGRLPEAADQARESRRRAEQLRAELGGQGG